jgi:hypothetical protein
MIRHDLTVRSAYARVLGGLVLCGLMTGCSDSSTPTAPTPGPSNPSNPQVVDRTFTLALNEGATVSNGTSELRMGFNRVVKDERCPGDAMCVQGMVTPAVLEFDVLSTQHPSPGVSMSVGSKTHIATDGPNSEFRTGVYSVRIENLAPYRFVSLPPINPEDWRVTIRITSALP